ncbi:MAG: hypothetical protein AAGK32_13310, partial [Actinomycetota bacterium]
MSDIVCGSCGHRNGPGSRFCSSCGEGLDDGRGGDTTTISFSPAEAAEIEEALDGARVARLDDADPSVTVRILVQ